MNSSIVSICYLIAASLFVYGIKDLSKPRTAVRGNMLAALGMLIAIVVTLFDKSIISYQWIIAGIIVGTVIGALMAKKVQMTNMPQMVAVLNGSGGAASALIAAASYMEVINAPAISAAAARALQRAGNIDALVNSVSITLTMLIGAITFSGSMIAYAKLQEIIDGQPKRIPGNKIINAVLLLGSLAAVVILATEPDYPMLFIALTIAALLLGVFLVLPIGGADMPVVIALLNSYSGIAAAAAGFITGNIVLIVSGALVGASGIILTRIMCVAMNRSLFNVLFGVMAEGGEKISADAVYTNVRSTSADEVAMMLETAQRVVIVPGFGLAMSQAQHAVRDLADNLIARGIVVEYAIHPVAGRMPGHMNVLLAEAEVPYELLKEMDEINPTFEQTDVAIVIGANDVTNPMAREDKGSPIYGMPILNVDKARNVVVVKRSLSPGFAGLPNPLFNMDNTVMLYEDGKKAIVDITNSLKAASK